MKRILSLGFFLLLLLSLKIPKHYLRWTGGFRPSRCYTQLANRPEWGVKTPSDNVRKILTQPFFFHRRGSQSYAFISQDEQYVLKLFAIPLKRRLFPSKFYRQKFPLNQAAYALQMEKGIEGYLLAGTLPASLTGLLYTHLNTTEGQLPSVILQDTLQRTYRIPLDSCRFVLQKRCQMLAPALKSAAQNNPEEAAKLIKSYVQAISNRASFAIRNNDTEFKKNFGVLEGQVIEFDCGEYSYDPTLVDPAVQQEEIQLFTERLQHWMHKYALDKHLSLSNTLSNY